MLKSLILLACIAFPIDALAAETTYPPPAETATEAMLRVQSSNQQASSRPQQQTARERDQSMQRWLDTYKYEIPDFYRWTKMTERNN